MNRVETLRAIREEMIRQGRLGDAAVKWGDGRGCAIGVLWKRECPEGFALAPMTISVWSSGVGEVLVARGYDEAALLAARQRHDKSLTTRTLPEDERYLDYLCWLDEQIGDPLPARTSAVPVVSPGGGERGSK